MPSPKDARSAAHVVRFCDKPEDFEQIPTIFRIALSGLRRGFDSVLGYYFWSLSGRGASQLFSLLQGIYQRLLEFCRLISADSAQNPQISTPGQGTEQGFQGISHLTTSAERTSRRFFGHSDVPNRERSGNPSPDRGVRFAEEPGISKSRARRLRKLWGGDDHDKTPGSTS
jgi:hypothetical protein